MLHLAQTILATAAGSSYFAILQKQLLSNFYRRDFQKKKELTIDDFLSIGVLRRVKIYYYIRYGVYYIVLSADIFLDF